MEQNFQQSISPDPSDTPSPVKSSKTKESNACKAEVEIGGNNHPHRKETYTAQFAKHIHQYIREYIRLADQKAAFIFAIGSALLVFLFEKDVTARWVKPIKEWGAGDVLSLLSMVSLAVAAISAIFVVVPRLQGSRRGYVFWKSIAEFDSAKEYAKKVSMENSSSLTNALLKHCYDHASVCRRKYRMLNVAIWTGASGVMLTILYLLIGMR